MAKEPVPPCHIPECGRPRLVLSDGRVLPVCASCRMSYLSGVTDAMKGAEELLDRNTCGHCGHFVHPGTPCRWHSGSCSDPKAEWCACPVRAA